MIKKLIASLLFCLIASSSSWAANMPFNQAEFDTLMKQGKPLVLHFHADWCPVCRAQQKVLDDLLPLPEFKDLPVLRVNFDKEKEMLRRYRIRNQSTFVVLKNGKEVTRSTGETDSSAIADLLKKAY